MIGREKHRWAAVIGFYSPLNLLKAIKAIVSDIRCDKSVDV